MTDKLPPLRSLELIEDTRPWAFTQAELNAGLRRYTGDPTLTVTNLRESEITQRRPSIGLFRGLTVSTKGLSGEKNYHLVLKEPQGSTRTGTAGVGLREVSLYRVFSDHLPVRLLDLLAAHPQGDWLIFNQLPIGKRPESWQTPEYLLATDQLVAVHDRFWGLGEDLALYSWLARPLTADLDIHLQAANHNLEFLSSKFDQQTIPNLVEIVETIINHSAKITGYLQGLPSTLLHGDYWPGNIFVHKDGTLTVFDWEEVAIGPGVLDLIHFVQTSSWWFTPLPINSEEIVNHYRARITQTTGVIWKEDEWQVQWDHALLWSFLHKWVALLPQIPAPILKTRLPALEIMILNPVQEAIQRCLK